MNALAQPIERVRDYLEDPWEMQIYRSIRAAALADLPCPTCDDLADLTGASAVASTVNVIHRLERKGVIKVERYQRSRRCYVFEVSKWTAPVDESPHWRGSAVTIGDLRKQHTDGAIEIVALADRLGIDTKEMLSRLVWAGAQSLGLVTESVS